MANLGLETDAGRCRKCLWASKYDDWDVLANTHRPVYYCTFSKPSAKPTLNEQCPNFCEQLQDEDEEGDW